MLLTPEEVRKIAELARIEISEQEVEKFQKELSLVLEYASELSKVDTEGVEEISQVTGLMNVMREDKPEESPIRDDLIKLFPESKDGYLKIKSIL